MDDASVGAGGEERTRRCPGYRERAHDVDGQDPLELLERGIEGRFAADDAGVAHADVDAAERRGHVRYGPFGSIGIADVHSDDVSAPTERADLRHGFRRVAALDEADVGAEPGERDRDRPPDALARSGDERDLAREELGEGRRHAAIVGGSCYSTVIPARSAGGGGYCGFSRRSVSTSSVATTRSRTHLRSAGTTCHGAHSVEVSPSASS